MNICLNFQFSHAFIFQDEKRIHLQTLMSEGFKLNMIFIVKY